MRRLLTSRDDDRRISRCTNISGLRRADVSYVPLSLRLFVMLVSGYGLGDLDSYGLLNILRYACVRRLDCLGFARAGCCCPLFVSCCVLGTIHLPYVCLGFAVGLSHINITRHVPLNSL